MHGVLVEEETPPPSTTTRRDRDVLLATGAAALSLFATASALVATRHGVGLSPDSARYLSVAVNMTDNHGVVDFAGVPLTIFPPGFPWLVSFAQLAVSGLKVTTIARVLNAASFGVAVWLGFLLLRRHVGSRLVVLGATAFIAVSAPLFFVSTMAWSEPVFLVAELAFLLVLETALSRPDQLRWSAYAGGIVGVAFLVRYAGLALLPVGLVSLALVFRVRRPAVSWRPLGAFLAASAALPALWMRFSYDQTHTLLGPRNPSQAVPSEVTKAIVFTLGGFAVPVPIWPAVKLLPTPTGLEYLAGALVAVAVVAVAVDLGLEKLGHARSSLRTVGSTSLAPVLIFLAIYCAYLVYSELSTALDPVDARLMAPIAVPVIVVLAVGFERAVARSWSRSKVVAIVLCAVTVLLFADQLGVDAMNAKNFDLRQAQLGSSSFMRSGLGHAARRVPADALVFTNNPQGLWLLTLRPYVGYAPVSHAYQSGVTGQVSSAWVATATCSNSYLAWFDFPDPHYFTRAQLSRYVRLKAVVTAADGVLYRIRPLPGPHHCAAPRP